MSLIPPLCSHNNILGLSLCDEQRIKCYLGKIGSLIMTAQNSVTFLGVLTQAKCEKCESTETAKTSAFNALNSLIRSLNAMISVGQTNVLFIRVMS